MTRPLEGVHLVEWGAWHHGVAAGAWLGDLGAEIVKIEEPVRGDPLRGIEELFGSPMSLPSGRNSWFELAHRNKKSLTLDLRHEKAREVAYRLIAQADVFYTNYRDRVTAKVGMDYDSLRRQNPKLIYASATTFGPMGPATGRRGFDVAGQARSGMMMVLGNEEEPNYMVGGPIDQEGSTLLAYGILAALIARDRFGVGQRVDESLFGSAVWLQAINVNSTLLRGRPMAARPRTQSVNPLGTFYRCADDEWIYLLEMHSDRYWSSFCRVVGIEDLEEEPRFCDAQQRRANRGELISVLDKVFATKTRAEWEKILDSIDMCHAPINRLEELSNDPQALENRYIVDYEHPVLGSIKTVGHPVHFSHTPAAISSPAPELGQHTEEVLLQLGYSWEEIAALHEAGAI